MGLLSYASHIWNSTTGLMRTVCLTADDDVVDTAVDIVIKLGTLTTRSNTGEFANNHPAKKERTRMLEIRPTRNWT